MMDMVLQGLCHFTTLINLCTQTVEFYSRTFSAVSGRLFLEIPQTGIGMVGYRFF